MFDRVARVAETGEDLEESDDKLIQSITL